MLQLTLVCPSPQELVAAISGAASLLTAALTLHKTPADRIPNTKTAFFMYQFFMVSEERKFSEKASAGSVSLTQGAFKAQKSFRRCEISYTKCPSHYTDSRKGLPAV